MQDSFEAILRKLITIDDETVDAIREILENAHSDPAMGRIKEKLLRLERFDAATNGVVVLMSRAEDDDMSGAAFNWLHFSYRATTYNHIQKKVRVADSDERDDLTQTIWLSIWASRQLFRPGAPFRPWMWTIVNGRVNDWLGKWYEQWSKLDGIDDHGSLRERPAAATYSEAVFALREAIERLPPKQKLVIQLRLHTDHCSLEQLALMMGLRFSNLKAMNARALQRLRELLSGPHAIRKEIQTSSRRGRNNHVQGI